MKILELFCQRQKQREKIFKFFAKIFKISLNSVNVKTPILTNLSASHAEDPFLSFFFELTNKFVHIFIFLSLRW